MNDETAERGRDMMRRVYGWDMPDPPGDFFAITRDHLFADIWTRPGLDIAQRRLLLIGMLAATGRFDVLDIQLAAALELGELDAAQLREIVVFVAHYAGWPTAATLTQHVERLLHKSSSG